MKAFTFDIASMNKPVITQGILVQEYYKKNKKHYGLPVISGKQTDFFPLMNIDETMPKILMQAIVQYDQNGKPIGAMHEPVTRCSESHRALLYFSPECVAHDIKIFQTIPTESGHTVINFPIRAPFMTVQERDVLFVVSVPSLNKDIPFCFDGNSFVIKLTR